MLSCQSGDRDMRSNSPCIIMNMHQQNAHHVHPAADFDEQPISRTYQYRKVMKPMLERKRRARINRCLDELKELMVSALQHEGENVNKLEKADILELTVRHLHRLRRQRALSLTPEASYADRFRAGFTHCASEVSRCLAAGIDGKSIDPSISSKLLAHLGHRIQQLDQPDTPPSSPLLSPPLSTTPDCDMHHDGGRHSVSESSSVMWRPW